MMRPLSAPPLAANKRQSQGQPVRSINIGRRRVIGAYVDYNANGTMTAGAHEQRVAAATKATSTVNATIARSTHVKSGGGSSSSSSSVNQYSAKQHGLTLLSPVAEAVEEDEEDDDDNDDDDSNADSNGYNDIHDERARYQLPRYRGNDNDNNGDDEYVTHYVSRGHHLPSASAPALASAPSLLSPPSSSLSPTASSWNTGSSFGNDGSHVPGMSRVSVVIRIRPLSAKEISKGHRNCLQPMISNESKGVTCWDPVCFDPNKRLELQDVDKTCWSKTFSFDRCLWSNRPDAGHSEQYNSSLVMVANQEKVYNEIGRPVLSYIMQGFNCAVFAFGQTG
jgi:Kinesin motor domain